MSRPKKPSLNCIKDITDRIELLFEVFEKKIKRPILLKDIPLTAEEAGAISGWSTETLRRYGTLGRVSTIKYGKRNFYLACEMFDMARKNYHKANIRNTSDMNNYRRRGRPRKGAEV